MRRELTNSFDKVYLTIEFDEANQWIYSNWIGILPTNDVVRGCEGIIELLQAHPCSRILNDNRAVVGSWSLANEWIAQQWAPQAIKLGLKRFAHVVSPGIFGQASAAEMAMRVGPRLEMRLFQDVQAAQSWLREPLNEANR
jgi:hypothetical protein